jgi:hypothetical protein
MKEKELEMKEKELELKLESALAEINNYVHDNLLTDK